jgi:hypothetical protein
MRGRAGHSQLRASRSAANREARRNRWVEAEAWGRKVQWSLAVVDQCYGSRTVGADRSQKRRREDDCRHVGVIRLRGLGQSRIGDEDNPAWSTKSPCGVTRPLPRERTVGFVAGMAAVDGQNLFHVAVAVVGHQDATVASRSPRLPAGCSPPAISSAWAPGLRSRGCLTRRTWSRYRWSIACGVGPALGGSCLPAAPAATRAARGWRSIGSGTRGSTLPPMDRTRRHTARR